MDYIKSRFRTLLHTGMNPFDKKNYRQLLLFEPIVQNEIGLLMPPRLFYELQSMVCSQNFILARQFHIFKAIPRKLQRQVLLQMLYREFWRRS